MPLLGLELMPRKTDPRVSNLCNQIKEVESQGYLQNLNSTIGRDFDHTSQMTTRNLDLSSSDHTNMLQRLMSSNVEAQRRKELSHSQSNNSSLKADSILDDKLFDDCRSRIYLNFARDSIDEWLRVLRWNMLDFLIALLSSTVLPFSSDTKN